MSNFIKSFVKDERGVTAIEYAIIAGLIAVALVAAVGGLTGALTAAFGRIVTAL